MAVDYKKLQRDLDKARLAAIDAMPGDDGGSCNLDTLVLRVPKGREKLVLKAIKAAGLHCRGKSDWLGPCYFVSGPTGGQGNGRTRTVTAMEKSLKGNGWDASVFYKVD
ncbi:hypothetical protein EV210_101221 [Anaerospora hongkongensis]|uniref:Uncharacterized protein n=1 Tax=Anaerospora hongkongensis TaxID=244830 RepID=A0A4R1QC42_9FIRM|nr:hypothetical protein [Anaerospora hongkongensis]TCL40021.1 hypothetical protein EV210_101221 [Anaerospora hongkongensis]